MSTTRRTFLATGLATGVAAPLLRPQPSWLEALANAAGPTDAVLVVVQIRGGWDQLQMLAEVDHPVFQAARPNIGLPKSKALVLGAGANHYWHPAMRSFKELFDRGDLAVLQNIGYPNPNLSHFVSEKKWYSADPSASSVAEGWLAAYLKKGYTGGFQIPAMNLEGRLNPSFIGARVPVFRNPNAFQFAFDNDFYARTDNTVQIQTLTANAQAPRPGAHANVVEIANGVAGAVSDSALLQTTGVSYNPRANYPNNRLAGSLQVVARYVSAGMPVKVFYTSHGGFDNHANEVIAGAPETGTLASRLAEVTESIKAFLDDMLAHGQEKRVVVMVFSEFSRRLGENGSLGTDHGHGGIAFFAGAPVRGGLYGIPPDLSRAKTPYNKYYIPFDGLSMDFRRMYADVITNWFNVADHASILGGTFPLIGAL